MEFQIVASLYTYALFQQGFMIILQDVFKLHYDVTLVN